MTNVLIISNKKKNRDIYVFISQGTFCISVAEFTVINFNMYILRNGLIYLILFYAYRKADDSDRIWDKNDVIFANGAINTTGLYFYYCFYTYIKYSKSNRPHYVEFPRIFSLTKTSPWYSRQYPALVCLFRKLLLSPLVRRVCWNCGVQLN